VTEQQLARMAKRRLAILRHAEEITGNVALTCRYYGISRQCFYTWRRRYDAHGLDGLRDRSHRPHLSPNATRTEVVGKIIYLRQHYHFGPARIAMYRKRYHDIQLSPSGVWRILKRLELNRLPASQRHKRHDRRWRRWRRYEKPLPGHRVQLDVKFIQPASLAGASPCILVGRCAHPGDPTVTAGHDCASREDQAQGLLPIAAVAQGNDPSLAHREHTVGAVASTPTVMGVDPWRPHTHHDQLTAADDLLQLGPQAMLGPVL
jgi:transposase